MKYCPHRSCPHRLQVRSPAEFLDEVTVCSDCGTPLVRSEEEAIAGLEPMEGTPYRASLRRKEPAGLGPKRDRVTGAVFFGAGLALLAILSGVDAPTPKYTAALVLMAFGFVRMCRGMSTSWRRRAS